MRILSTVLEILCTEIEAGRTYTLAIFRQEIILSQLYFTTQITTVIFGTEYGKELKIP